METLLEVGKKAFRHAEKLDVDEAELFLYKEDLTSVRFAGGIFASRSGVVKGVKGSFVRLAEPWIKRKGIPFITSGTKAGVGIRAVAKKAVGFASVSSLEERRVLEAVEEAAKIANVRPPDPNWNSLPEPKKPLGEGGVFDEQISNLDIEETLQLCADCCVAAGDFDRRITQATMGVFASATAFAVLNTRGVETSDRRTSFMAFVSAKAKSGKEEVSSGEQVYSRTYTEGLREVAVNASKRTIECFGKKPLPEKHAGTVVFENSSWSELFSIIFASGISALNVQENRSIYKDKIGKQVASDIIQVVDDGTLQAGFGTGVVDDEGVPKQKTPVLEDGVLQNFLHNNYSAKREQRDSTGNASRYRLFGAAAYANQPTIQPTNLVMEPKKGSLADLVKDLKNGVLVKGSLIGVHTSNEVTGDFSVTADNAFKIENGAVAYPLKACTLAGNFYDALNSAIAVGDDSKCFGNVVCPSITVDKIVVAT